MTDFRQKSSELAIEVAGLTECSGEERNMCEVIKDIPEACKGLASWNLAQYNQKTEVERERSR